MRLNPPDLDISENSPFDPDHLKREPHIKYLTQFVSTIREPFVLAIDAPWGTGKPHSPMVRETVLGKDITKLVI